MRCDVLAVGTELLLGQIIDSNSAWMGEQLAAHGYDSLVQVKVGDNIDRIIAIWSECHNKYSGDSGWLFGHFTIADAMFAPVVIRFRTYGINLPQSAGYYPHRVLESEAMQDWLAAAECEIEVIDREEKGR